MKWRVLVAMLAMVSWCSGTVYDFTVRTAPEGVLGVTAGDVKDGGLLCGSDRRYRLRLSPEQEKSTTLTLQVWFVRAKFARGQNVLLFSRKSVIPHTNIGFFFGFRDARPEFKWWDVRSGYEGILSQDVKRTYLPGSPAIRTECWQRATAVLTPQSVSLYVNGRPAAVKALPHPLQVRGGELNLGIGQFGDRQPARYSYPLQGVIGRVLVETSAHTAEQVRSSYERERGLFTSLPSLAAFDIPECDPQLKTTLAQTAAFGRKLPAVSPMAAGQVSVRMAQGVPGLFIDGQQEYPMMFMPSPWQDDAMGFVAFRDFAAADFTLNSDMVSTNLKIPGLLGEWWKGERTYDFQRIDRRFNMILKANPKARILIRIKMDPPAWWWTAKHPEFRPVYYKRGTYEQHKNWCGLTSREWQDLYSTMLRDFIRHVEGQPYGKHIIGYLPGGGSASEWWYHGQDHGLIDYSPIAQRDFRTWLKARYGTVAALNQAWRTAYQDFAAAAVPTPRLRLAAEHGVFRDPIASRPARDYCRYLNELTLDNVRNTAAIVKEETGGRKLVGYFYGYMTLGSIMSFGSLHNNGHSILGELVRNPQVDFFATPLSYGARRGGLSGLQIGNFNGTYALHGKLFWDEADYRTHFAINQYSEKCRDADETECVLRRTFGQMLSRGHAVWWFSLVGNHVFHSNRIMEDMKRFMAIGRRYLNRSKASVAQVALVMDEGSIPYVSTTAETHKKMKDLLWKSYENANCSGVPVDLFLSSDLSHPRMRDYKLYIFANQFHVTPEQRQVIHGKLRRNGAMAVWLYAPGYVTGDGLSLEAMRELTGLAFKQVSKVPEFAPQGPAIREIGGFTSVYSPRALKPSELRDLARKAGVHVYVDGDDAFTVNESFMTLHAATAGDKTIVLRKPCARVVDVFTERTVAEHVRSFTVKAKAEQTMVFRLDRAAR